MLKVSKSSTLYSLAVESYRFISNQIKHKTELLFCYESVNMKICQILYSVTFISNILSVFVLLRCDLKNSFLQNILATFILFFLLISSLPCVCKSPIKFKFVFKWFQTVSVSNMVENSIKVLCS